MTSFHRKPRVLWGIGSVLSSFFWVYGGGISGALGCPHGACIALDRISPGFPSTPIPSSPSTAQFHSVRVSQALPDDALPENESALNRNSSNLAVTTPSSLVVKGRKGSVWFQGRMQPLRRNLTLRFTTLPDSVTVYAADLKDPDGDKVYASEYISCEAGTISASLSEENAHAANSHPCSPAVFEVDPNGLLTLHIHFGLYLEDPLGGTFRHPPSGEFSGELLIIPNYGDRPELSQDIVIPILLRVQDGWVLPLLILLFGVAMGMTVSAYSGGGKLSDEVTVGLNRLQTQIDRYRHEAKSFAIRAETYIEDARAANQAQQLEEAQQAVNQANRVWRKWYRQRTEWKAQFDYHAQLTHDVQQELDFYQSLYLQTTGRALDDMLRKAPEEFADPGELRLGLQGITHQIREYGHIKTSWNQLKALVSEEFDHIGDCEQKKINAEVSDIKETISSVIPTDREGVDSLKVQLSNLINRVKESARTPVAPSFEAASALVPVAQKKRLVSKLMMIPSAPTQSPAVSEPDANVEGSYRTAWWQDLEFWPDADGRLRSFYISSYIGSVVMLASVGFSSLYVDNPTFGSDFFADYFSLVAWGFGAEATRDTVTKVVRKTDETNKE